jgi:uncharacterized protein YbcV (DUF1398 family)
MSKAIETLQAAQTRAMKGRPKVGGFPYLAETLRRAGVRRNQWFLPSCQSQYLTKEGPVVTQGTPLVAGTADEFLSASWRAGVVRYDVDFDARTVTYYGCNGEEYIESYPAANVE